MSFAGEKNKGLTIARRSFGLPAVGFFLVNFVIGAGFVAVPQAEAGKKKAATPETQTSEEPRQKDKKASKGDGKTKNDSKTTSKDAKSTNEYHDSSTVENGRELARLKRQYRLGEIGDAAMWTALSQLHDDAKSLNQEDRSNLLQTQASMLLDAGFPILAAVYATQAIKLAADPIDKDVHRSWVITSAVSQKRPIQNLVEALAEDVDLKGRPAPVFGSDWNYFVGNAAQKRGENTKAQAAYADLKVSDRYFFPSKYQQALSQIEDNKPEVAIASLKAILFPASQQMSPLSEKYRNEMASFANLALARIYYEQKDFMQAIKHYRKVSHESLDFYDALFEQAWAFFMAGYPNHALGAIHGVESPFFANAFNPEASMLKSIVYYWMCRYEDSRGALAEFMEKHSDAVASLGTFLDRQRLSDETAYQLFENLISGVSSESLGIPRNVVESAAEKDTMMLVRDQFAAVVEERQKLESKGIFGSKKAVADPASYLDRWALALRKDIGKKFLAELRALKTDYERLYDQAEFLYVELLMSEKDQLLGKELHASTKISHVSMKQDVAGWGHKTFSWAAEDKGEFWWDEVGFYIYKVEPQCSVK